MFIELKGEIYNLYKHSKVTREVVEFGGMTNKIILWNGLTPQTYLEYGENRSGLEVDWEFIKTSASVMSPSAPSVE